MLAPFTKRSKITNNPERSSLLLFDEILKLDRKLEDLLTGVKKVKNEVEEISQKIEEVKKMEGPEGKKGEAGEKGERGESLIGPKGDSIIGPRGPKGEQGLSGETGKSGKDGRDGKDGKPGKDGEGGTPGKDGKDGTTIHVRGGGGVINGVTYYDISASLNGSDRSFWLPSHMGIIAVIGSSFPFIFRPEVDYVQSGQNILFDNAIDPAVSLAGGQTVTVLIKRN